jgi:hypothetical protein
MKILTVVFSVLFLVVSLAFGQEGKDASSAPQLVSAEKLSQAVELLRKQGIPVPASGVIAIGFETGVAEHTSVVVITIDQNLNPVKAVHTVTPDFYAALMEVVPEAHPAPPALFAASVKAKREKQETGRIYFILSTAVRTLTIYPAGFATLMGDDQVDARTVTGLSLLTFGASLYGSYQFTKNRELGYGRVAMLNYGGELAAIYSLLTSRLIYGLGIYPDSVRKNTYSMGPPGQDTIIYDSLASPVPGKIWAAGAMLGFPLGIYLGSKATLAGNYQYGNADIMRFFGRSALLYGFLLPMYSSGGTKYRYSLAASGLSMGLIPTGIYLGHRLVQGKDYSSGRGFMIETSGIMGALTGLLVPQLFDVEFDSVGQRRIMVTSILAGHILGTTLGFQYKPKNSYNFFQGVFTAFSAGCGAAIGLSIPFLAQADSSKPYIIAGLLGGWGGFFAGEHLAKSLFEVSGQDKRSNLDISLPIAYTWPFLLQQRKTPESYASRNELVRITYDF